MNIFRRRFRRSIAYLLRDYRVAVALARGAA